MSLLFQSTLRNVPVLCCLLLIALGRPLSANGQTGDKEALLAERYLADTARPAEKIRELDSLAMATDRVTGDKGQVIRIYQMALALAPYVREPHQDMAMMYARFSGHMFQAGARGLAVRYQQLALGIQRRAQPRPNDRTYNMLGTIGSFYLRLGHPDSALIYYRQALTEARAIGDPLWISAAYNNLGILQADIKQHDSARASYRLALAALGADQSGLRVAIQDNLAQLATLTGDYDTAMHYYDSNLALATPAHDTARLLATSIGILETAAAARMPVTGVVARCETLLAGQSSTVYLRDTLRFLSALGDYSEAIGDVQGALRANMLLAGYRATETSRQSGELNAIYNALHDSRLYQFGREIDRYQSDLAYVRRQAALRGLIAALAIVIGAGFLLVLRKRYRERHRQQEQKADVQRLRAELAESVAARRKLEEDQARRELKLRDADLADLGLYLGTVKRLYQSLTNQLANIKDLPHDEQRKELRRIVNELNIQIQTQDKLGLVQEHVRENDSDWNIRIIEKYPNMTKAELELCAFIRLNLSNKDIAALKNISQDSVKTARHRLRKKLGLGQEDELYRFISSL